MTGRVQQREHPAAVLEHRLLGKYSYPSLTFEPVRIQIAVAPINTPEFFCFAGDVEHRFRERGLARVNMRQHPDSNISFVFHVGYFNSLGQKYQY